MAKLMKRTALVSVFAVLLLTGAYLLFPSGLLCSLAVTAGTTAYHFCMRLAVGYLFDRLMHNRADYRRPWFRPRPFEKKLYGFLRVREWKKRMPAYDPSLFSPQEHTLSEIAGAMCQAELVHEVIALCSFLPIAAIPFLGAPGVFIITSALAAGFDLLFVMMQRYNRPRIVRLIDRQSR